MLVEHSRQTTQGACHSDAQHIAMHEHHDQHRKGLKSDCRLCVSASRSHQQRMEYASHKHCDKCNSRISRSNNGAQNLAWMVTKLEESLHRIGAAHATRHETHSATRCHATPSSHLQASVSRSRCSGPLNSEAQETVDRSRSRCSGGGLQSNQRKGRRCVRGARR